MRQTFAVGRVDGKTSELVWLRARRGASRTQRGASRTQRPAPFPGPWKVRAVVGLSPSEAGRSQSTARVIPFPGVTSD